MDVRICLSFSSEGINGLNELDQILAEINQHIHKLVDNPIDPDAEIEFSIEDSVVIKKAKSIYDFVLPIKLRPCHEVIQIKNISPIDLKSAEYFIFARMGNDASGYDDCDSAEEGNWRDSIIRCDVCGNKRKDVSFSLRIRGKRLPKKNVLFTFYSEVSTFCRPEFIKKYQSSGLTGLDFTSIPRANSGGVELYKVNCQMHKWKDDSGICRECQMKTNMRWVQFFNLPEDYACDFQRVLLFDQHYFVISRRAVEFLGNYCDLSINDCYAPIVPGHLIDKIYPEKKLFYNGDYPTRVLRAVAARQAVDADSPEKSAGNDKNHEVQEGKDGK